MILGVRIAILSSLLFRYRQNVLAMMLPMHPTPDRPLVSGQAQSNVVASSWSPRTARIDIHHRRLPFRYIESYEPTHSPDHFQHLIDFAEHSGAYRLILVHFKKRGVLTSFVKAYLLRMSVDVERCYEKSGIALCLSAGYTRVIVL